MTVQEFPVKVFTSGVGASGGGGLTPTLATSTPITATAGNLYVVDVATIGAAITANLPALPTDGDQIAFCDGGGSDPNSPTGFGLHTLTINPDAAHDIQGVDPLELDRENEAVWLTFDATLNRWTIVSAAIGGGPSGIHLETIGNGVDTNININHGLGTEDVFVVVYDLLGNKEEVLVETRHTDSNNIDLVFSVAPAASSLRVVVSAGGGGAGGSGGGRELLTANRTYYVDATNGNDSTSGLGPGIAAFQTIQKGLDVIGELDTGIFDVTLQLADDTYSQNNLVFKAPTGSGKVILLGNTGTPANVIITCPVVGDMTAGAGTRRFIDVTGINGEIRGVRIQAQTAQNVDLITVEKSTNRLTVGDVEFNGTDNSVGTSRAVVVLFGGTIFLENSILLDNLYNRFASVFTNGVFQTVNGLNFTFGGSCDCTFSFVRVDNLGYLQFSPTATMVGTNVSAVTRADVSNNSVCKLLTIATALTTATFTAQTVATGGQYTET